MEPRAWQINQLINDVCRVTALAIAQAGETKYKTQRNIMTGCGIQKVPCHVAIVMQGSVAWAKKNNVPIIEAYKKRFEVVTEILKAQGEIKIPVLTFYLLPKVNVDSAYIMEKIDSLSDFLETLQKSEFIHKNGIKINVWGRWYDLPGRIVDNIKKVLEETKDYDTYFVNFCINYDGQDEVTDACKIIAKKVQVGKIDPEAITKEMLNEELYASFFLPPELLIRTGTKPNLRGFLLWSTAYSTIYFPEKLWPDFTKEDFIKAIEYYDMMENKGKKD